MKSKIANTITLSRIFLSFLLFFSPVFSVYFYIFYIICGFSDMIDGTVARKTTSSTKFGAKLDTIADIIFVFVCLIKVLPKLHISLLVLVWCGIIAFIKICNIIFGIIRHKKFLSQHTISNKITGLLLFLLPLTLNFFDVKYSIPTVCAVATFSAIQEAYYIYFGFEIV